MPTACAMLSCHLVNWQAPFWAAFVNVLQSAGADLIAEYKLEGAALLPLVSLMPFVTMKR